MNERTARRPGPASASAGNSLAEAALERIRDDIQSCRLAPGEHLTERGLAERLGMGIAPVRDALTRLDQERLVQTLPRKGYRVTPMTVKSVDDLFEFWAFLGPEIARRGVPKATHEQIREVSVAGKELRSITDASREEVTRCVVAADRVFTVLAEATANDYLIEAHKRIHGEVGRVWRLVIESEFFESGRRPTTLTHSGDFVQRRDAEGMAEFLREHIRQSHDRVLRSIARWPSVVSSEIVPLRKPAED